MKLLSNLTYNLKQGLNGLIKNKTMSLISIISVTSALIILGIILTMVLNINQFIEITKDEINEIRVSSIDNLETDQRDTLKAELEKILGVKSVEYKSKEELFNSMKESWGEDGYLLEGIDNPLDDTFIVTLENSEKMNYVVNLVQGIENVKEVKYQQDIVQNFLNLSNTVKKFGGILMGALLLICLIIISNTIKSRVYSKKEEIEIIKYVGGSDSFIKLPFIVEGFTIGMIGSAIALFTCIYMYDYILENVSKAINFMNDNMMIQVSDITILLSATLFITGITIGVLGSVISVKKYLRV